MEEKHLKNREKILARIAKEVFGPGDLFDEDLQIKHDNLIELDTDSPASFKNWNDYNSCFPVLKENKEEILKDEKPSARYGVGILFPQYTRKNEDSLNANSVPIENGTQVDIDADQLGGESNEKTPLMSKLIDKNEKSSLKEDDDASLQEFDSSDLRLANRRNQQTLGVSFVIDTGFENNFFVEVRGAFYRPVECVIEDSNTKRKWWARYPLKKKLIQIESTEIATKSFISKSAGILVPDQCSPEQKSLHLDINVRGRALLKSDEYPESARLVTFTLVNRTPSSELELDQHSLFQSGIKITSDNQESSPFLPYPQSSRHDGGQEQSSMDLLYRNEKIYATGHGCAGTWETGLKNLPPSYISAEPLPWYETPSVTSELIISSPGEHSSVKSVKIPLQLLADESKCREGILLMEEMINGYRGWIESLEPEIHKLSLENSEAAESHIERCRKAFERMKSGLDLLKKDENSDISIAFRLANKAMLMQALQSGLEKRTWRFDSKSKRSYHDRDYKEMPLDSELASMRNWRPFQIAFFLMNLESISNKQSDFRETVDLIWFPTGGGKTEAYLACAAFSIFLRRLRNQEDSGTEVLMRYTLRLLTAQQFQRASSLICSMEILRRQNHDLLGHVPFTIGIWVGGETTPNKMKKAVTDLKEARYKGSEAYKFIYRQCPWCSAEMGPVRKPASRSRSYEVLGVIDKAGKIGIHCPDPDCPFHEELPARMVDDDIYEQPPTYLIATVDKFASLAWKPEARRLFGRDENGDITSPPPGMIIQDELHLISGPLGSMVGLYEMLIDELCRDRFQEKAVKPKMICATATTRASSRQIRELYARSSASIFPPPGLEASDSFFARYAYDSEGKLKPGRKYLGIMPLSYSSNLTANVRVFSAALVAVEDFENDDEKDPWWTLLLFYNSLRELGAGLTLCTADIPERMKNLHRKLMSGSRQRYLNNVMELTGRLESSDVPLALDELSRRVGNKPVDVCLASNIIEVGVDVDRLSIMGVIGQPKGTAQYIQATGRIGRRIPGAVLTLYNKSKARDRSHYEHFQAYHSKLYAGIEPASVTPFTVPVLERALHAVFCAWILQTLPFDRIEEPSFSKIQESSARKAVKLLEKRILSMNYTSQDKARLIDDLNNISEQRMEEWSESTADKWVVWFPTMDEGKEPLLSQSSAARPSFWQSWDLPTSMRGVDAECRPHIPNRI